MIQLIRTNSANKDFAELVKHLDADLRIRDGNDHPFYAQFNKIDDIKYVVLAYLENEAVGCGAIKAYDKETMEVKRMFVPPECRGKGIATKILTELENWTKDLGYQKCILETGIRQPEAIALYKKSGYNVIPNFGQYSEVNTSVCFEKAIQ